MTSARAALRPLGIAAFWALSTMTVVVVLTLAVAAAAGDRSFTVMSGSMEPAISTGDVIVTSRIARRRRASGRWSRSATPSGARS